MIRARVLAAALTAALACGCFPNQTNTDNSRAQIAAWAVAKGLAQAPQDLDTLSKRDD